MLVMIDLDMLWDCSYGSGYEDSPSMPVRGLGVSFGGTPEDGKCLISKTQRDKKLSVRKSHGEG